ncbi:MAG TPA: HNH endonuclease [Azospirillaceae bacterium]|nr:HNH endonuclease [Azospirillaceae bacterium]
MGSSLKDPATQKKLQELQADSAKAAQELKLDLAQSALDVAGIFDPTPVSDAASALISAARGDWLGAGLSLISIVPYFGDAAGKSAKLAKLAARIADLRKRIADNLIRSRQIISNALKKDAAAIRAARAKHMAEKIEEAVINGCTFGGSRFGTQTPKHGWKSGERGHGEWNPRESGYTSDIIAKIEGHTGGASIRYVEGYPDFSKYVGHVKKSDGTLVPGRVEIQLSPTGNRNADFINARAAMAEKLGLSSYKEPENWTWHHKEDGVTMELIPSALHENVRHTGGVSLAKDPTY